MNEQNNTQVNTDTATQTITDAMTNTETATQTATGMPGLAGLKESLPIMAKGMIGIFLVTAVIIAVVALLNKTTTKN